MVRSGALVAVLSWNSAPMRPKVGAAHIEKQTTPPEYHRRKELV